MPTGKSKESLKYKERLKLTEIDKESIDIEFAIDDAKNQMEGQIILVKREIATQEKEFENLLSSKSLNLENILSKKNTIRQWKVRLEDLNELMTSLF